jgi:hypothetical protein
VSKFQSILDVANTRQPATRKKKASSKQAQTAVTVVPALAPRRGRPAGKRSDPDYEQVTAYIKKETHKDVKIGLLQEGQGREFSELVEDLLSGWLKART